MVMEDIAILPFAVLLYLSAYLDRGNLLVSLLIGKAQLG